MVYKGEFSVRSTAYSFFQMMCAMNTAQNPQMETMSMEQWPTRKMIIQTC